MNWIVKYQVRVGQVTHHRELHTTAGSSTEARRIAKHAGNQEFPRWSEFKSQAKKVKEA